MKKFLLFIVLSFSLLPGFAQKTAFTTKDYVRALKDATDIMVSDVTSPVAAARYYSYITMTANELVGLFDKDQPVFAGFLEGFSPLKVDKQLVDNSDMSFAAVLGLYAASKKLLPSGPLLKSNMDSLVALARKTLPKSKVDATESLVSQVLPQMITYAMSDGFMKLSGYRRFTPANGDGYWQPTAPGFMAPIEPHWASLRTFFLDSCSQFAGAGPVPYNADPTSRFYSDMMEVYTTVKKLDKERSDIAMFWDCNPFALQQIGHLEFGIKKLSPGGHWIGITGIACKKQNLSIAKTAYAHTLVSLGLEDAFISCWDKKYKYNRIRPVTAINRLVDKRWSPLLQTPPFPEYTSGHSVISTAAAQILTYLFGDHFSFTDDTELEFGLAPRSFPSFIAASREAAISRLYGGIHFRDAIENGVEEGTKIGKFVVANCPTMKDKNLSTGFFKAPSKN